MRTIVALALTAMALGGCGGPKQMYVDGGWVRLGAVKGAPAAAYFTVHGGPVPATLIRVSTDVAIRDEMHETMAKGNMTAMAATPRVDIPANATVAFAPGGRHVMLFDVNPGIKPGTTITLTLTFADGLRLLQSANVVGAGDPEPK